MRKSVKSAEDRKKVESVLETGQKEETGQKKEMGKEAIEMRQRRHNKAIMARRQKLGREGEEHRGEGLHHQGQAGEFKQTLHLCSQSTR